MESTRQNKIKIESLQKWSEHRCRSFGNRSSCWGWRSLVGKLQYTICCNLTSLFSGNPTTNSFAQSITHNPQIFNLGPVCRSVSAPRYCLAANCITAKQKKGWKTQTTQKLWRAKDEAQNPPPQKLKNTIRSLTLPRPPPPPLISFNTGNPIAKEQKTSKTKP